jgi:hypothetical protein
MAMPHFPGPPVSFLRRKYPPCMHTHSWSSCLPGTTTLVHSHSHAGKSTYRQPLKFNNRRKLQVQERLSRMWSNSSTLTEGAMRQAAAYLAPATAPTVLHLPVLAVALILSVSHSQNTMVESCAALTCTAKTCRKQATSIK